MSLDPYGHVSISPASSLGFGALEAGLYRSNTHRLCILIVKPPQPAEDDEENRPDMRHMYGPGGYAIPSQPIRVTLARDEEAAGVEDTGTKAKPPAYGLWRESVVSSRVATCFIHRV